MKLTKKYMGVCINQRLAQNKEYVKQTLDRAQGVAEAIKTAQAKPLGIPFNIRRLDDYSLLIDIGQCETLAFEFKSVGTIKKECANGWSYEFAVLTDDGKKELDEGYEIARFPQNEIWYSASFCKTQFSHELVQHKWVADIIRVVASFCRMAEVDDEGDYYHTGTLEDAAAAIQENGALINSIGGMLTGMGYDSVMGGETHIAPKRKKK